jgi:alkanesulfonate monooxygenase SsuD/methylene tetrahydromethanopterin reductase-like flavin-dependent oxidoreductase (luciferase family)
MWVAAGSPSTFEKAGRMGLGVLCFTMGGPAQIAPLIATYKEAIAHAEPVGEYVNDNVMVTTQLLCLEDRERVRDLACNLTMSYQNSLLFRYLDTFPRPPGIPEWPDLIPEPTPADIEERMEQGSVMYGTPDDVVPVVKAYEAAGADQVVFGLLSSTMPCDVAVETIENFGRHVLPEFDRDPVHRTTRQREAQLGSRS